MEGSRFGKLVVLGQSEKPYSYNCLCDCGNETSATKSQLTTGRKKSCGCLKRESRPSGSKYRTEVGEQFGRLTVTSEMQSSKDGHYRVECICECGNSSLATVRQLVKGQVVSCGCKRLEGQYRHGMCYSRPASIHQHMKRRCNSENEAGYPHYGGRGISYDPKWETFEGFWEDMQEGYSDELELDRIDPNGNYCKENCRWADQVIQNFNTRKRKDNTSGKSGVSWNKRRELWEVYINIDSNRKRLGCYEDLELAIFVREEAELTYYGFIKE